MNTSQKPQKGSVRLFFTALLFGTLTACSQEELQIPQQEESQTHGSNGTDKTFVVDYALHKDSESRTVPGNRQRICSLHYFLYDADNLLTKKRVIPDINENTTWPLTRANMTWAQREALKDTLSAQGNYTAIFVANLDASLHSGATSDQILASENLETVCVTAPVNGFTPSTLYYAWKDRIRYQAPAGSTAQEDPRKHPLAKKIVLRRIVSKAMIQKATNLNECVNQALDTNVAYRNQVETGLNTTVNDLVDKVRKGLNVAYGPNCDRLLSILTAKNTWDNLIHSNWNTYKTQHLLPLIKKNGEYQKRTQDWINYKAASLQLDSLMNVFSLETLCGKNNPAVATGEAIYPLHNDQVVWMGIAENDGTSRHNTLRSISFYKGTAGTPHLQPDFKLPIDNDIRLYIGKNKCQTYTCNPVASIQSTHYSQSVELAVNMQTIWGAIDQLTDAKNGFVYDGNQTTPKEFSNQIRTAAASMGGWEQLKVTVRVPAADDFQFTANIQPCQPPQ